MTTRRAPAMPILPLLLATVALGFAIVAAAPPVTPRSGASVEVVGAVRP